MSALTRPLRSSRLIPRTSTTSPPRCSFSSTRWVSQEPEPRKTASPHAQFYSDLVPGMIPIALLGSAIYLGLQLIQTRLSHEKYLDEARARVDALEAEVDALRAEQTRPAPSSLAPATKSKSWFGWS